MAKCKNKIQEITEKHVEMYEGLREGTVSPGEAKEATNAMGKIIGATKLQLEFAVAKRKDHELEVPLLSE